MRKLKDDPIWHETPAGASGWVPCAAFLEVTGKERCWGPTVLDFKRVLSSVFSLELFCLELEGQLTSNLLTEQFSPLLKADYMPMHVRVLPAPGHLYIFKHVSNSQKSRALLMCFEYLWDRDLKENLL